MGFKTSVVTFEKFLGFMSVNLSVVPDGDTQRFVVSTEPKRMVGPSFDDLEEMNKFYTVVISPREPISMAKDEKLFKMLKLDVKDGKIVGDCPDFGVLLGRMPKGEGTVEVEIYQMGKRVGYYAANVEYDFSEGSGEMPKHQAV